MITRISNGKIILEDDILHGKALYFEDNKITHITSENLYYDCEIDARGNFISPGLIDIHTHGGGNSDFMDGTMKAYITAAKMHAAHGTTTMVPTTLSGDINEIKRTFEIFNAVKNINHNGAGFAGLHLEGPYFAMSQKGAQDPRYIRVPTKEEYERILSWSDNIIRWSAAPELEGALAFGNTMKSKNILPSIGHTDADYDQVVKAFDAGFTHITHLYSCMSTVHRKNAYRYAGVIESAYLIDDMTVEIIADGVHLPPPLLEFTYKFKGADKIALITDSMRGAGMPDGESILGSIKHGQKVIIEDGVAKLEDKSAFAGSVATMDRVVRTMLRHTSANLTEVIKMATKTPARIIGLKNKGSLALNMDADIVIFNDNIEISTTVINGRVVYTA